jgi:hypothetical protein
MATDTEEKIQLHYHFLNAALTTWEMTVWLAGSSQQSLLTSLIPMSLLVQYCVDLHGKMNPK